MDTIEKDKEDILQKLSETLERFRSTNTIQMEDGCNIIEALIFIIKGE